MNEKFLNYVETKKNISKECLKFIEYLSSKKQKYIFGGASGEDNC